MNRESWNPAAKLAGIAALALLLATSILACQESPQERAGRVERAILRHKITNDRATWEAQYQQKAADAERQRQQAAPTPTPYPPTYENPGPTQHNWRTLAAIQTKEAPSRNRPIRRVAPTPTRALRMTEPVEPPAEAPAVIAREVPVGSYPTKRPTKQPPRATATPRPTPTTAMNPEQERLAWIHKQVGRRAQQKGYPSPNKHQVARACAMIITIQEQADFEEVMKKVEGITKISAAVLDGGLSLILWELTKENVRTEVHFDQVMMRLPVDDRVYVWAIKLEADSHISAWHTPNMRPDDLETYCYYYSR